MGNCSGLFANCNGEDPQAVRRVDGDKMAMAMQANQQAYMDGQQMMNSDVRNDFTVGY